MHVNIKIIAVKYLTQARFSLYQVPKVLDSARVSKNQKFNKVEKLLIVYNKVSRNCAQHSTTQKIK